MWITFVINLVLAANFLNFLLREIQLGAQCLLGELGPLNYQKTIIIQYMYSDYTQVRVRYLTSTYINNSCYFFPDI